jgi:hypothetical protein
MAMQAHGTGALSGVMQLVGDLAVRLAGAGELDGYAEGLVGIAPVQSFTFHLDGFEDDDAGEIIFLVVSLMESGLDEEEALAMAMSMTHSPRYSVAA